MPPLSSRAIRFLGKLRLQSQTITTLCLRFTSSLVYKNNNPRNLELLALAPKRQGWEFQAPRVDYWNKVHLEKSAYHTTGRVVHQSGKTVVFASTREPSIQKHLYSCIDVSAAANIGRILALRCHQCGLLELFFDEQESPLTNESVKAFYESMMEGGVSLKEQPASDPPKPVGIDYAKLTAEEKRSMYPSLIETLRSVPDWDHIPYPYSLRPKAGKLKLRNSYQILSKVRQGMVWDSFYKRMVLPENKAYWQHEFEAQLRENLEKKVEPNVLSEPVQQIIPSKWQLK